MKTLLLATASLMLATSAVAQDVRSVYELFTSQGCSSCPPANADISRLSKEPGVLALSFGVTYWDYLGWEDTFAHPDFTERQRDYVRALEARNPYTPQIVMNGRRHDPRAKALKAYETLSDSVTFGEIGSRLEARGTGEAVLVTFHPGTHSVPVARGENHGRTLELTNVVRAIEEVSLPHRFRPESGSAYALLQHGENMRVEAAAVHYPKTSQDVKP